MNLNLSSNLHTYAGTVSSDGTTDEKNKPGSSTTIIPGKVIHYGVAQTEESEEEIVQEAAKEFAKTADEYISAMNSAVRTGVNSSDRIEAMRETNEAGKNALIVLQPIEDQKVSDEVTNAAYACLAEFFREYREKTPAIGDIDISASMISIEAKIVKEIKTSFKDVNVKTKYGKYTAKLDGTFYEGAFACTISIR